MKIEQINTYNPKFQGAKISKKAFIPVISRGESYPPQSKFMCSVRDILGEMFPKLDPDYDIFIGGGVEKPANTYTHKLIDKILMALR